MGGFSLYFPGSGSFLNECRAPKHLTDSSAGAELNIASWAGKAIIPVRMLLNELRLGSPGPTTLEIDASALLDAIAMDKVSRKQHFQAANDRKTSRTKTLSSTASITGSAASAARPPANPCKNVSL